MWCMFPFQSVRSFQFERLFLCVCLVNTAEEHVSHLSSHQNPLCSVKTTEWCLFVEVQVMTLLVTDTHADSC